MEASVTEPPAADGRADEAHTKTSGFSVGVFGGAPQAGGSLDSSSTVNLEDFIAIDQTSGNVLRSLYQLSEADGDPYSAPDSLIKGEPAHRIPCAICRRWR